MDHLLKLLADYCDLSPSQYWHLRLLSSIALGPLLSVLYLVISSERARRKARAAGPSLSLWVGSDGRLLALPRR